MPSITNLELNGSTTDSTTFSTASVNPSAAPLLFMFFADAAADPTVDGLGLTWTKHSSFTFSLGEDQCWVYVGHGTVSGADDVTVTFGITQPTFHWWLAQVVDGANSASVIVQSDGNEVVSTSVTVTLASFASGDNIAAGMFMALAGSGTWTAGTGFTKVGQTSTLSPNRTSSAEHGGADNTVDMSFNVNDDLQGVAVELTEAQPVTVELEAKTVEVIL